MNEHLLQSNSTICYQVVNLYRNLLNSYITDYYVENHWDTKLPNSWQIYLLSIDFNQLQKLLDYKSNYSSPLVPLSILCIREILKKFAVERNQQKLNFFHNINNNNNNNNTTSSNNNNNNSYETCIINKCMWKNVKLKKRHEIKIVSDICLHIARKNNCKNIIDIGSGLEHLTRLLSYFYNFNVCTFEANNKLTKLAVEYDNNFAKLLKNKNIPHNNNVKIIHINKKIEENFSIKEFENDLKHDDDDDDDDKFYGIIGLHPCGNLGSTLLRLYNESPKLKFLLMASCCYMKLTLNCDNNNQNNNGFPLSKFNKTRKIKLDYLLCESACHAIENYSESLTNMKNLNKLKIHSFRACLEFILIKNNLKNSAIGNVKYYDELNFNDYCIKALKNYNLFIDFNDINYYEKIIAETWINVVKFYSIRLLLAPLVESVILYDRLLYLIENNNTCNLLAAFDCKISPRCNLIIAQKKKNINK